MSIREEARPLSGAAGASALWLLTMLTAVNICSFMDRQLIGVLAPSIRRELNLNDTQIGVLAGPAFALFYVLMGLPLGRLAERVDRRRMIAVVLALWCGMTALSGTASGYLQLVLYRMGVAVGETGASPPSYAMLSDAFSRKSRTAAIAVYASAGAIGSFFGLLIGGWATQSFGWRGAFLLVGSIGLLIFPLVLFTIRDPQRGGAEEQVQSETPIPFMNAIGRLFRTPTFVLLIFAASFAAFTSYSFSTWMPSFVVRTYHLDIGRTGSLLSVVTLIGGVGGTMLGGFVAKVAGERDLRWWFWGPAIGMLLAAPLVVCALLLHSLWIVLPVLMVSYLGVYMYSGPVWAAVNTVVPARIRATASATMLLIQATIGLGVGPLLTGYVSDRLKHAFGADGLRYALLVPTGTVVLAALFLLLASRTLRADATKAELTT